MQPKSRDFPQEAIKGLNNPNIYKSTGSLMKYFEFKRKRAIEGAAGV